MGGKICAPEERFWGKVEIADGCWEWKRCLSSAGYGKIGVDGGSVYAHRLSWEMANGEIPDGASVLHHCDNPPCVRPDHLFLGSKKDNTGDAIRKGRFVNPPIKRGVSNHNAKLTDQFVVEIRKSTLSAPALAIRYNVAVTTIEKVRARSAWKHVP